MQPVSLFLSLPAELIFSILRFLNGVDLLTCIAVAKQLRKLVSDSSELQYTIELMKYRMTCVIPASATPPFASRINSLHVREQAWRQFNWRSKHRLNIPPSGLIYEFVGGLYATGDGDGDRLTRSIAFWELPTFGDEASLRSWTHLMEGVTIIDFTMDPAQDLLALVTLAPVNSTFNYEIHLRSIVTNETYPKALMPKLLCSSGSQTYSAVLNHPASVRIQILGDLIALLVKEASSDLSSHLEIWDWVNSPQVSCKLKSKSGIEDFALLSNDAFLIARTTGSLETYTFHSPITDSSLPVSQYNYVFPQLSDGYMYLYISISTHSVSTFTPRSYSGGERSKQQLYSPKPEERIYMCTLCVFDPASYAERRFNFCFNPQILLQPPDEWKAAAIKSRRRRTRNCNCAYTSPSIPIPSHQPLCSLARPPSNAATSSSSATAASSSSYASPGPTTSSVSARSSSFRARSRPVLRRPKLPKAAQNIRGPVIIPWHVWGPQSTRWFEDHGNTDWQHSVYGLRTIDSVRVDCLSTSLSRRDGNAEEEAGGYTSVITCEGQHEGNSHFADSSDTDNESELSVPPRFLRLRDYNPYSIRECLQIEEVESLQGRNGKGQATDKWRGPRVVTHPTTTDVKGVFIHDVVSLLPYVEVLSKETFRVTDVMMDDCRVLLQKRGQNGVLKRVDMLAM